MCYKPLKCLWMVKRRLKVNIWQVFVDLWSFWPGIPVTWPRWPSRRPRLCWTACCESSPPTPRIHSDRCWRPPCPSRRTEGWSGGRCRWTRPLRRAGWQRTCGRTGDITSRRPAVTDEGVKCQNTNSKGGANCGNLRTVQEIFLNKGAEDKDAYAECWLCLLMACKCTCGNADMTILKRGRTNDKELRVGFETCSAQSEITQGVPSVCSQDQKISQWIKLTTQLPRTHTRV